MASDYRTCLEDVTKSFVTRNISVGTNIQVPESGFFFNIAKISFLKKEGISEKNSLGVPRPCRVYESVDHESLSLI